MYAIRSYYDPGLGILFRMRRYQELIDEAQLLMFDLPDDVSYNFV